MISTLFLLSCLSALALLALLFSLDALAWRIDDTAAPILRRVVARVVGSEGTDTGVEAHRWYSRERGLVAV